MAKRKREVEIAKLPTTKPVNSSTRDNKKHKSASNAIPQPAINGDGKSQHDSDKNLNGAPKTSLDAHTPKVVKPTPQVDINTPSPTIQIVTGSYERVLHGIQAHITFQAAPSSSTSTTFTDTFLFNAHTSAIRSLALSPLPADNTQSIYLATGSTDERINVYSLSTSPLPEVDTKGRKIPTIPSLGPNSVSENPMNRELGTLTQHTSTITALHFPTRSKLLSGSEDNTISVTRVRDMAEISSIRAPRPKLPGQASGDSISAGTVPTGINDFAIHPSMKLMISVGRGERCMRLWNLVTGKKAGVLNFEKDVLMAVKEGKFSHGEGRRIQWNTSGMEFAVSFERGVVVFGEDSRVRAIALPQPLTKVHQIRYVDLEGKELLAVSTENGQIIFFDTSKTKPMEEVFGDMKSLLRAAETTAVLGGKESGIQGRIKDFVVLDLGGHQASHLQGSAQMSPGQPEAYKRLIVVAASSDGAVRLFSVPKSALKNCSAKTSQKPPRIGVEIGQYETGSRITCLDAFVMLPPEGLDGGVSEFENNTSDSEGQSEDESD